MAKPFARSFYDSELWKSTRRQVLRRDKYACKDCGCRATIVHHIVELTPGNINDCNITINPTNLMSLCHECHNKRHAGIGDVDDGYAFDEYGQLVKL